MLFSVFLLLFCSRVAYALSETVTIASEVEVVSSFTVITDNPGDTKTLDFGAAQRSALPNGAPAPLFFSGVHSVRIIVDNNNGSRYRIRHEVYNQMMNARGTLFRTIDDSTGKGTALRCMVTDAYNGDQRVTRYPQGKQMTQKTAVASSQDVYISDAEGNSDEMKVLYFLENIIPMQEAGNYQGSIIYSMIPY